MCSQRHILNLLWRPFPEHIDSIVDGLLTPWAKDLGLEAERWRLRCSTGAGSPSEADRSWQEEAECPSP